MESYRTKDHLTAGGDALQSHSYTFSSPLEVYHSLQSSHQCWHKFLTGAHCKIMTWHCSSAASAHLSHMQIISFLNIYTHRLDLVGQVRSSLFLFAFQNHLKSIPVELLWLKLLLPSLYISPLVVHTPQFENCFFASSFFADLMPFIHSLFKICDF